MLFLALCHAAVPRLFSALFQIKAVFLQKTCKAEVCVSCLAALSENSNDVAF